VEPLGENTGVFLDFVALSDFPIKYQKNITPTKQGSVKIPINSKHIIQIRGMFSGSQFPLEQKVAETLSTLEGTAIFMKQMVVFPSRTIKGFVWWYSESVPPEALKNRPEGTIFSFRVPEDQRHQTNIDKAFIFS